VPSVDLKKILQRVAKKNGVGKRLVAPGERDLQAKTNCFPSQAKI